MNITDLLYRTLLLNLDPVQFFVGHDFTLTSLFKGSEEFLWNAKLEALAVTTDAVWIPYVWLLSTPKISSVRRLSGDQRLQKRSQLFPASMT